MQRLLPALVALTILFFATSTLLVAGPKGCKLQGSWLGLGPAGDQWVATYSGHSAAAGTSDLEFPAFDPTLGDWFQDAVAVTSARGVWERTGERSFAYTLMLFGVDPSGTVLWVGKNSGDKILSEDCNVMTIESTFEILSPGGDPLLCLSMSGSQEFRLTVEPQCTPD